MHTLIVAEGAAVPYKNAVFVIAVNGEGGYQGLDKVSHNHMQGKCEPVLCTLM